eukprot:CAMPEP_0174832626 /NCGR_PEP_ID=MMETSP1114-20130205/3774_1 /TAXON_ID=312471 /ORGANISM="Neobodo designis, Strain CCAP 1951/1" /LENGTH=430 /DNA_ID=CAMNT_0016066487 /DNA_START=30 /DNA_END=1319 /DNA_ORIENTATION=+
MPSQQTSAPMTPDAASLSVLSFNVWGVFVAQRLQERMRAISERLAAYDVVCLQEQFDRADAATLFGGAANRAAFPHVHRFESSAVGSGLTIASRYPVVSHFFVPFRLGGKIHRVWEGDAFANKGISVTRIAVPRSKLGGRAGDDTPVEVLVLNTHLIAQYQQYSKIGGYKNERNAGHRLGQAHQLAQLIVSLVGDPRTTPFIVCGDFNCGVGSPEMQLLQAYLAHHGLPVGEAFDAAPSYDESNMFNARGAGTYLEFMSMTEDIPVQLDHILYGTSALARKAGSLAMTERFPCPAAPQKELNLSDHYGIAGQFAVNTAAVPAAVVARPRSPSTLEAPARDAMAFAATYLKERVAAKQASMRHLNAAAAALAFVALVVVPAATPLPSSYPVVAAAVQTGAGFAAAIVLTLAHLYRRFEIIAMRTAAEDLES